MICPSAATLKSYPRASGCTGKTVEALCHLKCNTAIDSIGLILNAMMSSSESWLNRFAIDCVDRVCVRAMLLCRFVCTEVNTARCLCTLRVRKAPVSARLVIPITLLLLPSYMFTTVSPFFSQCINSMPFMHKQFNNYDLQVLPPWLRQWKWYFSCTLWVFCWNYSFYEFNFMARIKNITL